jgi:hypothetical protein
MTLTEETAEQKFPRAQVLRTSRKIGNARCAVPEKKCSSRWGVPDPPKMSRNKLAKPGCFDKTGILEVYKV